MASPEFMSNPYMCCLCYETINEGEHQVDHEGQKWDSHQLCHDWDIFRCWCKWSAAWAAETQLLSSVGGMVENENYQKIIELGWDVVPLIIWELAMRPDHWFCALAEITGTDAAAGETTVSGAAHKWVEWWRDQQPA